MTRRTPVGRRPRVRRHAHPAVLIDRAATKLVSAGDASFGAASPDGSLPAAALVEAMVQAALGAAGRDPERGVAGLLVACDDVRIARRPVPGDRLRFEAAVVRRFGDLIRVASRAVVESGPVSIPVAEGVFTLRRAGGDPGGGA